MLAGFLLGQLEAREIIQSRRKEIWETYFHELQSWASQNQVRLPFIPEHCEQSYHMFYLLMPDLESRQRLIQYLKERGILSVFHYLPLHLSEMGRKYGGKLGDCPVTESISDRLLRLPFYYSLRSDEQAQVIQAITQFQP